MLATGNGEGEGNEDVGSVEAGHQALQLQYKKVKKLIDDFKKASRRFGCSTNIKFGRDIFEVLTHNCMVREVVEELSKLSVLVDAGSFTIELFELPMTYEATYGEISQASMNAMSGRFDLIVIQIVKDRVGFRPRISLVEPNGNIPFSTQVQCESNVTGTKAQPLKTAYLEDSEGQVHQRQIGRSDSLRMLLSDECKQEKKDLAEHLNSDESLLHYQYIPKLLSAISQRLSAPCGFNSDGNYSTKGVLRLIEDIDKLISFKKPSCVKKLICSESLPLPEHIKPWMKAVRAQLDGYFTNTNIVSETQETFKCTAPKRNFMTEIVLALALPPGIAHITSGCKSAMDRDTIFDAFYKKIYLAWRCENKGKMPTPKKLQSFAIKEDLWPKLGEMSKQKVSFGIFGLIDYWPKNHTLMSPETCCSVLLKIFWQCLCRRKRPKELTRKDAEKPSKCKDALNCDALASTIGSLAITKSIVDLFKGKNICKKRDQVGDIYAITHWYNALQNSDNPITPKCIIEAQEKGLSVYLFRQENGTSVLIVVSKETINKDELSKNIRDFLGGQSDVEDQQSLMFPSQIVYFDKGYSLSLLFDHGRLQLLEENFKGLFNLEQNAHLGEVKKKHIFSVRSACEKMLNPKDNKCHVPTDIIMMLITHQLENNIESLPGNESDNESELVIGLPTKPSGTYFMGRAKRLTDGARDINREKNIKNVFVALMFFSAHGVQAAFYQWGLYKDGNNWDRTGFVIYDLFKAVVLVNFVSLSSILKSILSMCYQKPTKVDFAPLSKSIQYVWPVYLCHALLVYIEFDRCSLSEIKSCLNLHNKTDSTIAFSESTSLWPWCGLTYCVSSLLFLLFHSIASIASERVPYPQSFKSNGLLSVAFATLLEFLISNHLDDKGKNQNTEFTKEQRMMLQVLVLFAIVAPILYCCYSMGRVCLERRKNNLHGDEMTMPLLKYSEKNAAMRGEGVVSATKVNFVDNLQCKG